MASLANKRSMMIFYSDPMDMYCHQVRIVLAEKSVAYEVHNVDPNNKPEELAELNPYNTVPVLLDRDLVLYHPRIIMEYLDERFPHPPLLPVYPVLKAKYRLMLYRIEKDWFSHLDTIQNGDKAKANAARKELIDSIISVAPVFEEKPYFFSDDFTLVDCALASFLWRLPNFNIELPDKFKGLNEYQERLFNKASFQASLTEEEKEIRAETII